ncbi:hypothetical protein GH733_006134 [Mirounga leonina]|nr:hypothetical protein GH733_006134 [Mirounga leonina]
MSQHKLMAIAYHNPAGSTAKMKQNLGTLFGLKTRKSDTTRSKTEAIRILIQKHLTQNAVAKANQTKDGFPVALDKHILSFNTGDAFLNEAAPILQLLHIEELQTKIHEAMVAVQAIIADPKTDHRQESWKMNFLRFQLFTYLVRLGTMYALACV